MPSENICPLCRSNESKLVNTYSFDDIWAWLAKDHGLNCTEELRFKLTPSRFTALLECNVCKLQYFSPAIEGCQEFYKKLIGSNHKYYNKKTWDFEQSLAYIHKGDKILDVGCGSGAFLKYAMQNGLNALGIDNNYDAVIEAQRKGLSAEWDELKSFSKKNKSQFDVVTIFQTVEHISEIQTFVSGALACLKNGGRLIISVPRRDRLWRKKREPLDCPPHHMSRWSKQQLTYLGLCCGLRVINIDTQPISFLDVGMKLCQCLNIYPLSKVLTNGSLSDKDKTGRMIERFVDHRSELLTSLGVKYQNILGVFEKSAL